MDTLKNIFLAIFTSGNFESHSEHFIPDHLGLMWFTIFSNALVVLSYALIPLVAVIVVRKRKDLIFNWVFLLIGLFICMCGITHLIEIITFWNPIYYLQAIWEFLTAVSSFVTFVVLIFVVPKIVKLTSPKQVEEIQNKLNEEIENYKNLEHELLQKNLNIDKSIKEISEKNLQLDKLNRFMIGREEKIIELEKELQQLEIVQQEKNYA